MQLGRKKKFLRVVKPSRYVGQYLQVGALYVINPGCID